MKKLVFLVTSIVLLTACSSAPTHPSLTVNSSQGTPAADWDGNGGYQISPVGKQLLWEARKGLNQGLFVKSLETEVVHSYGLPWLGKVIF
jgi:hypothetical protein